MTTTTTATPTLARRTGLPYLILPLALTALALLFLFPAAWEFPMDDTYIHFVYAQNLAETGRIAFNDADEIGVGSTSLTWVALLAGAYRLGIPFHISAKLFGLLSLIACGLLLYRLTLPRFGERMALAFALLVAASGHLLWFSLSGMETTLFLALGLLALLLYGQRRWAWLGLVLGLLALTRPDGLALAAAVGLIELWQHRADILGGPRRWQAFRGLALTALVTLLVCGPWFGYLLARTGHLLPTSAVGKQTTSLLGIQMIVSRSPELAFLTELPALIYVGTWVMYLLMFVLGGMALPGPGLPVGAEVGNAAYAVSYLGMLGWLSIVAPVLVSFIRGLPERLKRLDPGAPLLLFAVWLVLHNLAYAFFLPIPGTASRYGTINHVALWLALLLGLRWWKGDPRLKAALMVGLMLLATANTLYWNRVYDANLEHMHSVRIRAAQYVNSTLPADSRIAAFDVGAIRYYTGRPILDLGGLIDPALGDVYRAEGRLDGYLADRGVQYIVLPGRAGAWQDGWFDFAQGMGLTDSPRFAIEQIAVFEIDHERWLLGYLPTNNYQATVTVYRVIDR